MYLHRTDVLPIVIGLGKRPDAISLYNFVFEIWNSEQTSFCVNRRSDSMIPWSRWYGLVLKKYCWVFDLLVGQKQAAIVCLKVRSLADAVLFSCLIIIDESCSNVKHWNGSEGIRRSWYRDISLCCWECCWESPKTQILCPNRCYTVLLRFSLNTSLSVIIYENYFDCWYF